MYNESIRLAKGEDMGEIRIIFGENEVPSNEELIKWGDLGIAWVMEFTLKKNGNKALIEFEECSRSFIDQCFELFMPFHDSKVWAFALDNDDDCAMLQKYLRNGEAEYMSMESKSVWTRPYNKEYGDAFLKYIGFPENFFDLFKEEAFEKDMVYLVDHRNETLIAEYEKSLLCQ